MLRLGRRGKPKRSERRPAINQPRERLFAPPPVEQEQRVWLDELGRFALAQCAFRRLYGRPDPLRSVSSRHTTISCPLPPVLILQDPHRLGGTPFALR